ncbi:hypothetical protein D3C75_1163620 [compost metagenome]
MGQQLLGFVQPQRLYIIDQGIIGFLPEQSAEIMLLHPDHGGHCLQTDIPVVVLAAVFENPVDLRMIRQLHLCAGHGCRPFRLKGA